MSTRALPQTVGESEQGDKPPVVLPRSAGEQATFDSAWARGREAAGKALFLSLHPSQSWDAFPEDQREGYRIEADAALAAALPHMAEVLVPSEDAVALAIADPGKYLARGRDAHSGYQSITRWSACAVRHLLADNLVTLTETRKVTNGDDK